MAARHAEELAARLDKRRADLKTEKLISAVSPVVVGGALIIPRGLLKSLTGTVDPFADDALRRREVELVAMKAVMDMEKSLGNIPTDVSAAKVGYDVESLIPDDRRSADCEPLRFIEVKGRVKGATTITVSKNEILTAFNKPGEYILAIVQCTEENSQWTVDEIFYIKQPFRERPDFAATSVNYNIHELVQSPQCTRYRVGNSDG
jgi:hypothetical protein